MKTKFIIPLLAGLGFLCACKNKGYEVVNNSTADSVKMDSTATGPKLVKKASIHFKVKNVQQTSEQVAALTSNFRGMIVHHEMNSTAGQSLNVRIGNDSVMKVTAFNTSADIVVKIPAAHLDEFMNQVAHIGLYVNNQQLDITDKSLDYLSSQLKLKSRQELVSQQKKGKIVIKDPSKVLSLKDDMIDQDISNREINNDVKFSVVDLSFYESNIIKKEIVANDDPSAYNLSYFKRFLMSVENGWGLFVEVIIDLTNLWVFFATAAITWLVIRWRKNKKVGMLVNNRTL